MKTTVITPVRAAFCLVLLLVGMLLPALAAADTFTFSFINNGSGTDISNLSIGTTDVSFQMAFSPLTTQLVLLTAQGTLVPSIFINDFQASTLVQTDEFDQNFITSVSASFLDGDRPVTNVTFRYETTRVLTPSATPEPSSLLLLGTGLLTGLGALRRKLSR